MKKKIIIASICAVIIMAVAGMIYASTTLNKKTEEENKHLVEITYQELEKKVNNKESFILVLTQTNCSHCHEYKPVLKKVLYDYDIYAYEVSTDKLTKEENAKLKDIANASGTPTTIFIENGEEKNTYSRMVGTQTESKLVNKLNNLHKKKEIS